MYSWDRYANRPVNNTPTLYYVYVLLLDLWKKHHLYFCVACLSRKDTFRDRFAHCCSLLASVVAVKTSSHFWLYLPLALMDFNQGWVIDANGNPHLLMRSKVTYQGQRSLIRGQD